MEVDRMVVREEEELKKKKSWFSFGSSKQKTPTKGISRPPSVASFSSFSKEKSTPTTPTPGTPGPGPEESTVNLPLHAGFDFGAIQEMLQNEGGDIGMSMQSPTPGRSGIPMSSITALGPPPPYSRSASVPLPLVPEKELAEKQRSVSARKDHQEQGDLHSRFDRALSISESVLPVPEARDEQEKTEDPYLSSNHVRPRSADAGERGAVGRDAALASPASLRGGDRDAWFSPVTPTSAGGGRDPFVGEDKDETEYSDFAVGSSSSNIDRNPFGPSYPTTFGNGSNDTNGQAGSAFSTTAVRSPAMESTVSFGGGVWGKETNTFPPMGGSTSASTSTFTAGSKNNAIGNDFGDFAVGSSRRLSSDPGLPTMSLNPFAGTSTASLSFGNADGLSFSSFPIGAVEDSDTGKRGVTGTATKTSDFWKPPPLPGQKKRSDTGNSSSTSTSAFGSNPWG